MAVDLATKHPDFFKYLLTINNNRPYYSDVSNFGVGGMLTSAPVNESSYVRPVYDTSAGKYLPAVKDDSGVTFNNSFVPPTVAPSRKRQRDMAVLPTAVNHVVSRCGNKESNSFSFLGEDMSLQIMNQQIEIDRLVSHHISKMKTEVENRKKHQMRRLMASIQVAVAKKMIEKDEQIDRIGKINLELEERVKTLCIENQLWRDLAQSNEATANALRTSLENVLYQTSTRKNADAGETTDDAVSCCGSSEERDIDGGGESQIRRGKRCVYRGEENMRLCRKCGEGESSVLLLPCKHLCLCASCGPTVNICPICSAIKNASVHVNFS